jgi:RHS repeat-associated protein
VFALQVTRTGNPAAGAPNTAGSPSVPGSTQTSSLSYFHHDHLGSIAAISDETGKVIERLAYDPWGKRRYPDGASDVSDSLTGKRTDRGYTEHEHLDEMGVIHMNGRVYDPLIGRMMSADPYVQAPANLKTFNRYAYVWNNPLKMYDPEGYFSYSVGGPNDSPGSGSTYTYTNSDGSRSNYGCSSCGSSSPGSSSYQAPAGSVPASIPTRPSPPSGQPTSGFMGQPIPYTYQQPGWWDRAWTFVKNDVLKLVDCIPPGKLLIGAAAAIRNADKLSDVAKALEKGVAVGDDAIRVSLRGAEQVARELPDATLVCRGGVCKAENFIAGAEKNKDGILSGVSTQSAEGASLNVLAQPFKNEKVGITTAGEVRAAGGTITADGSIPNPNHASIDGLTGQQLESLFSNVITNPVPKNLRGLR